MHLPEGAGAGTRRVQQGLLHAIARFRDTATLWDCCATTGWVETQGCTYEHANKKSIKRDKANKHEYRDAHVPTVNM